MARYTRSTHGNTWSLVVAALLLLPASALPQGGECAADVAKVDAQLGSTSQARPKQQVEAKRLRDRAVALCEAGAVQDGLLLLAQAKQVLGIQ